MKQALRLVGLVGLLMFAPGVRADSGFRLALMSYRVTNTSRAEATKVNARCVLPATNRYQHVLDVLVHPDPIDETLDGEGQRVVTVPLGAMGPGQTKAVHALAWVRLREVKVPLSRVGRELDPLPPDVRDAYLSDSVLLRLDEVRPIAEKAVEGERRDFEKAQALYKHMLASCRYNIDGRTDSATAVLSGKPASCSELAYAYVALCRSIGIPARTVSAYVNREGGRPWIDWVCHRWAEFYGEGIGWVPVDPTNALNHSSENFFARQTGKYLVVLDSGTDGSTRSLPGWFSMSVQAEPRDVWLDLRRSGAFRDAGNRRLEREFFEQACRELYAESASDRQAAVERWANEEGPLRAPFLVEALFDQDPQVRSAAAAGIARTSDFSTIQPLMDRARFERDINVLGAILETLRTFLGTEDEERKGEVVEELAKSRTDLALELLDGIWDDPGREVRKKAALTLLKFGNDPIVHEGYRELAEDEDEYIRIAAALRWARVGSYEALEHLVEHLESDNAWDREQAVEELVKRTGDDFGFNYKLAPTTRTNRKAIPRFQEWLEANPDAK